MGKLTMVNPGQYWVNVNGGGVRMDLVTAIVYRPPTKMSVIAAQVDPDEQIIMTMVWQNGRVSDKVSTCKADKGYDDLKKVLVANSFIELADYEPPYTDIQLVQVPTPGPRPRHN